jgi:hypothetical protein
MSKREQTAISFKGDDGQRLIAIGVVHVEACPTLCLLPKKQLEIVPPALISHSVCFLARTVHHQRITRGEVIF